MRWPARRWQSEENKGVLLRQTTFFLLIGLALSACTGHNDEVSRHGKAAITRDYGYVIGDIVPVDYRFDLKGDEIDITSLPPVGPLNEWLNIRGYHVEHHPHRDGVETRLHIDYQIFKGIKEPELLTVPSLSFRLRAHPESTLTTDPWTYTQVPVIPPDLSNETIEPQEGMGIGLIDIRPASQRLAYWFSGLLIIALMMLLRRSLQRRKYRPFQSAQSKIRAAFREGADAQTIMEGMRLMHRALDHTYGQTLFRRDIPAFLKAHPTYLSAEASLQAFFALSGRLFFIAEPYAPEANEITQLVNLLGQCVRAERGQL